MTHDELLYGIKEIERLAEGMWGTKALRAAVELHSPIPTLGRNEGEEYEYLCNGCYPAMVAYPCLTLQVIVSC